MHWLKATLNGFDTIPTPNAMGEAVDHTHTVKRKADFVQVAEFDVVSAYISSSMTAQLLPT